MNNSLVDAAICRLVDFVDILAIRHQRHLERELVWVKEKDANIWVAFQDCVIEPIFKRDVAMYDETRFLFHIIESKENPNEDCNVPYKSYWRTFDLSKTGILKSLQIFKDEKQKP